MSEKIFIAFVLCGVFFMSFVGMSVVTDSIARYNGFYDVASDYIYE